MQQFSDEELVAKFREDAGPSANRWIDELFRRYQSRVAVWCLRFTGNRDSAADLAQDVFLKVYRNIHLFRGDAKFSTWLYAIVRNHCLNEMKGQSARPQTADEPLEFDIADVAQTSALARLEKEEAVLSMRALVNETLDETEKAVMVMHYAEEITLDAITRLLRLQNASGAKAYIVSAKRKLAAAVARLNRHAWRPE
jgi:RNA polymerase sigma-70 factor (ECF subfamily)